MLENRFFDSSNVTRYVKTSNPRLDKNGIALYVPKTTREELPRKYTSVFTEKGSSILHCSRDGLTVRSKSSHESSCQTSFAVNMVYIPIKITRTRNASFLRSQTQKQLLEALMCELANVLYDNIQQEQKLHNL
jgi:hypothetical protein